MPQTRRQLLSTVGGAAAIGALAGCADGTKGATTEGGATVQASFFIFGDLAGIVAGDGATTGTLVPIGQHGHGWEPGPGVRQDIRDAELLFHNMAGFQPWLDDIASELDADSAETTTVDVSADVNLLEAGVGRDDREEDNHNEEDASHDPTGMDPHFWMDPRRVATAVDTIQAAFTDTNTADSDDNAAALREQLDSLHAEIESVVEAGTKDALLIAGHNSFSYFADRYGVEVISLTGVGPNDQPSPKDIQRAQSVIETNDLKYICADPLESQQAAEQLVADTDAAEVLPLTAMPGLTETWANNDWGYLDIMESVNLPTLERALDS
jgi:ABC-type metal ion transport system, periplasmic component/surface adhesin